LNAKSKKTEPKERKTVSQSVNTVRGKAPEPPKKHNLIKEIKTNV